MANSRANVDGLQYLPFEDKIAQIDSEICQLQQQTAKESVDNAAPIRRLQGAQTRQLKKLYSNLTPWQTVQVSLVYGVPEMAGWYNYR